MKAITLHQPWASLIACGAKKVETRGRWHYKHRGPVLIHASREEDRAASADLRLELAHVGLVLPEELPLRAVVAVAHLSYVVVMDTALIAKQPRTELLCGDWRPGRFALGLADVRPLPTPFAARGAQGLFDLPVTLRELGL